MGRMTVAVVVSVVVSVALAVTMATMALTASFPAQAQPTQAQTQQPEQLADELLRTLNQYRVSRGLQPVPLSPSMTRVARAHVADLERNPPQGVCNGHSWSPSRRWKACCYTDDHAKAQCMWDKPREITGGVYPGSGFEIWAWRSGKMTLQFAVEGWKGSPAHHDVLINKGPWATVPWRAMGAAVSEHYAVVWFGSEDDPEVAEAAAAAAAAAARPPRP